MRLITFPEPPNVENSLFKEINGTSFGLRIATLTYLKAKWLTSLSCLGSQTLLALDEAVTERPLQFDAVFKLALIFSELKTEEGQREITTLCSPLQLLYVGVVELDPRGAWMIADLIKDPFTKGMFEGVIQESLVSKGLGKLALRVVDRIETPGKRYAAYDTLSMSFARRGDFESAIKAAKLLPRDMLQDCLLRHLSEKMILKCKEKECTIDRAQTIAFSMPNRWHTDKTLLRLSRALLSEQLNDLNRSKSMASMIKNKKLRSIAYSCICKFLIGKGQFKEALEIAHQFVKEKKQRSLVISSIAIGMCRRGDVRGGLTLLLSVNRKDLIDSLNKMTSIRARQGNLGEALYLMGIVYDPDSEEWVERVHRLFDAVVSESHFKDAIDLSKWMPQGERKNLQLNKLVSKALKSRNFESAIEATEEMQGNSNKSGAVRKIFNRFQALDAASS